MRVASPTLLGTWPTTQACALSESNQWSFGSQASTQSTDPYQLGHNSLFFIVLFSITTYPPYIQYLELLISIYFEDFKNDKGSYI